MSESFTRTEKKYLLSKDQYHLFKDKINEYIIPDKFSKSKISTLYYDNKTNELIRRSIEKPKYKEKFRVRCYGDVKDDDLVFAEIKKKLNGIVYKRRTKAKYKDLMNNILTCAFEDKQVGEEIKYFAKYYNGISPSYYISSYRTSYISKDDPGLRITFDEDLKYRNTNLDLKDNIDDKAIFDGVVMEIKVSDSYPPWLYKTLDDLKLYPRGFSKVGNAFIKENSYE